MKHQSQSLTAHSLIKIEWGHWLTGVYFNNLLERERDIDSRKLANSGCLWTSYIKKQKNDTGRIQSEELVSFLFKRCQKKKK